MVERSKYFNVRDFHRDTLKSISTSRMLADDDRLPEPTRVHHREKIRVQQDSSDPIVALVAREVPYLTRPEFIGLLGQLFPVLFRNGRTRTK